MRNLTIARRKSFVGCAMKDQVYIRDDAAPELTIAGVPCRKIGDIKNGEIKTFSISEAEQQIFVIADRISKEYCNDTVTVPEGTEDVVLAGVHKFVFGSNPFRFDSANRTPEQLLQQKKNSGKGVLISICAAVIGGIIGLSVSNGLFAASPMTFTKEDFQITLTDEFSATEEEDFFASYTSDTAMVLAVRDDKSLFEDITLAEYGELVLSVNNREGHPLTTEGDLLYFEYTDVPDGQEIYYFVVCCEGENAFWIVNFATPASNRAEFKQTFLEWAKTLQVG
jgi:hypothetical protein